MREVVSCLLCGETQFEPLLALRGPVSGGDGPRVTTTFVSCRACGFVFQTPTLDEEELHELYGKNYRALDPPIQYQKDQLFYARLLCDWIESRIGPPQGRRVLDVGCAAGFFLSAFRERGWQTVGIDANPRWTEWGRQHQRLDLRDGFFDAQAFPGEQFDLILFSHIVEHLPDPVPTLRAIRAKLKPDGHLFLGAPNILLPPRDNLLKNFMARPHVCLYSPQTVRRLLAKANFAVTSSDNWYPRGMRVLAQPADASMSFADERSDDWKTLRHLYTALTRPARATTFGRNLAALVPSHYDVLEAVAAKTPAGTRPWNGANPGELVRTIESGQPARLGDSPTETPGDPGEWPESPVPGMTLIMIGLGAGWAVQAMVRQLEKSDARLVVCEPDSALVRAVLTIRDLTDTLGSARMRMVVGPHLVFRKTVREWLGRATEVRVVVNPWLNDEWRRRYQPIAAMLDQRRRAVEPAECVA